jgi:glyoxylase-like metal-dependent hydrolase (beta-lactamase superfamily II)
LTGAKNLLTRFYQLLFTDKWGEWLPIYSWLIEIDEKLILIDTGETAKIYDKDYLPKGGLYHKAVQTKIKEEEEISFQIKSLGYDVEDVKTIILTHLHGDHIGGIQYFPKADFYVSKTEYEMAISKKGPNAGYFKQNWPSWFAPKLINYNNEKEGTFDQCYQLHESDRIVIVPTPGHSVGHQSVIVKSDSVSYFIGGDLTYNVKTLNEEIPNVVLMNKEAKESVRKVREYVQSNSCIYLSSHDWNAPEMIKHNMT